MCEPSTPSPITHFDPQRLVNDPPEHPCAPLSDFLESAAISCPKAFFKPVFTCAASMKELTIANQLCALHSMARFFPGMWTHSADMMSVALMTDPSARPQVGSVPSLAKGKARYGQMAVLVELIQHMRRIRTSKDLSLVRRLCLWARHHTDDYCVCSTRVARNLRWYWKQSLECFWRQRWGDAALINDTKLGSLCAFNAIP